MRRDQLERKYREDPANEENALRLADLDIQEGRFERPQRIYLDFLDQATVQKDTNKIDYMRKGYIAAKGFCPERTEDEVLGDSFVYHNLPVQGKPHTLVQGLRPLERGEQKTWPQWRLWNQVPITGPVLEGAITRGWFANRNRPSFRDNLEHYMQARNPSSAFPVLIGEWRPRYQSGTGRLQEYALSGNYQRRTLQAVPPLNTRTILATEQPPSPIPQTEIGVGDEEGPADAFIAQLFDVPPASYDLCQTILAFQHTTARTTVGSLREVSVFAQDLSDLPDTDKYRIGLVRISTGFIIDLGGAPYYGQAYGWRKV